MARHNKEMTTETKQMILRLKREGYAHRKIAEIIGRDHSTITKFLKRYDERNSVHDQQLLVFHLRILHVSNIIELTWQAYLCTNLHDFFG
jgi:IS30 family transposase